MSGATAIMIGESTRLLLGIVRNRWLIDPAYVALKCPAWPPPGVKERPVGFENFEIAGGAYW